MNKERRAKLKKLEPVFDMITEVIEQVQVEEQDAFDNMPEGLQCSDRGCQMEENIDLLEEILDQLDDIWDKLEDL